MSSLLRHAVKGRVPMIHIRLDDGIYAKETLEEICGETFTELGADQTDKPPDNVALFKVSRTGKGLPYPRQVFEVMRDTNSTLVYANMPQPHLEMLDLGGIAAPASLIKKHLEKQFDKKKTIEILGTMGGLTLKDAFNILRITKARDNEKIETDGLVKTRRALIQTSKGLSLIDTYMPAYVADAQIESFVQTEKNMFLNGGDPRLRARGLLLDGEPGTGKTAASKYIARQWGIPLFRIDATFQDKWVGNSEAFFDMALKTAEAASPAVLLIDEIEKFFGGMASGETWGGMSRVMGSLLWFLQEHRSRVLTVMTTNNKKAIPPELYREGRVDKVVVVKPLETHDQILSVAKAVWESFTGEATMPEKLLEFLPGQKIVDWKGVPTNVTPMKVTSIVTAYVKANQGG